nr:uncharacterized protein LOC123767260 [Procambarus clarkii]
MVDVPEDDTDLRAPSKVTTLEKLAEEAVPVCHSRMGSRWSGLHACRSRRITRLAPCLKRQVLLLCTTLVAGLSATAPSVYQAVEVQQLGPSTFSLDDDVLDIINTLLPDISKLLRDFKARASDTALHQAKRFKDLIELFIPLIRRMIEFEAEDEGRAVREEDLEMLKNAELALSYLNLLAESEFNFEDPPDMDIGEHTDLLLPDYTREPANIQDITIPEVKIPGVTIPDVVIPETNLPGLKMSEKRITIPDIEETTIPRRRIPFGARNTRPGARNTRPGARNTRPGARNTRPGARNTRPGRKVNTSASKDTSIPASDTKSLEDMHTAATSTTADQSPTFIRSTRTTLPGFSVSRRTPASRKLRHHSPDLL